MATDWSLDFCLVCDRQTLGGPYCSQSCRLAELDVPRDAISSRTPESREPPKRAQQSTVSISLGVSHGANIGSLPGSSQTSYPRVLSPSSSQTSLSSLKSNSSQKIPLSHRFQNELRDYASCFDQVRDLKRRLTA